ncbi:MAG: type II toxin-antitoxin system HicB family antitoxin [Limisphaerales bacterium]
MRSYTYTLKIEPAEEGGFNVFVPALSGCYTQGKTYEEAVEMARDAIRCYLEVLVKRGEPIPEEPFPKHAILSEVQVRVPIAA